jgi:hypothetical protein
MKTLVLGAVLAALVAAPAWAQSDSTILPTPPAGLPTGPVAGAPQYAPAAAPTQVRRAPRANPFEAYGAVTSFGRNSAAHMNSGRAAALQECSAMAQRYVESTWGNMDAFQYRACMAAHGQAE